VATDSTPAAAAGVAPARFTAASAAGGFGAAGARARRASAGARRGAASAQLPPFTLFGWVSPPNDSTTAARIQELAGAGLNVALPAWADSGHLADNLRRVHYAADAGVRCLAWDDRFDRIYNQHESIALLDTIVADYASEPGFLGYYFTDEPQPVDFPLLGTIYADLRARDPVHPAFDDLLGIGAFADVDAWKHYARSFLDATGAAVLCDNHYDFLVGHDSGRFVENVVATREVADEYGIPFWSIVLLVQHGNYRALTGGELRWQVSQLLAYGARGVGYFTYWTPAPDPKWNWQRAAIGYDGVRGPWYDVLAAFNPSVRAAGETLAGLTWLSTQHAGSVPRGAASFVPDDWVHAVRGRAAIGRFAGGAGSLFALVANSDSLAARSIGLSLPGKPRVWRLGEAADLWSELPVEPELGGVAISVALDSGGFALLRLDAAPAVPGPVLAVGPNPAHAAVRFAVAKIGAGARLEIVDTQGRRVWSTALTPNAGPVTWGGEREGGGHASPGIYFARVTDSGGLTTARFSWLGSP
jgi:hypothetical protein